MIKKNTLYTLIASFLLLLIILWALSAGAVHIPAHDIIRIVTGHTQSLPDSWIIIIQRIRLPRVLGAAMVGGILSVGGVCCQGLFRNPLCEPYLLGISSGAALGAALAIVTQQAGIGAFAFAGAMAVTIVVFLSAGRSAFRLPSTLLLKGIAIAFLCQSLIWLLMTFNRDQVERIAFWTLGSLSSLSWSRVGILAILTIPITFTLMLLGRVLDILSTGHQSAYGLGLSPQSSAALILALTALGTATAVATSGLIGFVGLMVPHAARIMGGPSHRGLILRSWIGGAGLLILADMGARTVNPPGEIPVGVLTALLGAPFIFVLVSSRRKRGRLDA